MALEYFLYTEPYNNTLIDRSHTSFAPLPADTGQILIDYFIPHNQPLYLFKELAGLIVPNDDATVDAYLEGTAPPSQPQDPVFQETFTAYTGTTLTNINTRVYRSGDTMTGSLSTSGNLLAAGAVTGSSVSASVLITTPVLNASTSVCAPRISGSTCITSPISCATTLMRAPVVCGGTCAISPIIIGSSCVCSPIIVGSISAVAPIVSGSTCVTSPITCATTRMQAPIVCGGTCVTSPITCGTTCLITPISCATTRMQAPIVCGGTCSTSPITCATTRMQSPIVCATSCVRSPLVSGATVCSTSCLCSAGTSRLVGATTAASTLNVSGNTTLGAQTYLKAVSTGGTLSDYTMVWNPVTKQVRTIAPGGDSSVYCYADNRVVGNNATEVNTTYLTRTWNLPSGYYEYEFSAIYGNDTSNRCAIICFLFDGAVIGSCNLMKTNDTNVRSTAYITQNNTITAGIHSASMLYRQCGGGTASVYTGTIRVQKIA